MTDDTTTTPATTPVPAAPTGDPAPSGGWKDKLEHAEDELREDLGKIEAKVSGALHHGSSTDPAPTDPPAGS